MGRLAGSFEWDCPVAWREPRPPDATLANATLSNATLASQRDFATKYNVAFYQILLRERTNTINSKHVRINDQIRVPSIRVITNEGTQLGIIPTDEALEIARESGLDLVEVAPNETPPVCRVMDYGKYKYQQRKKLHNGKVHHTKIKEIRLRPKTGAHDIAFKVKQAKTFLASRDKVQVSVVFRGREIVHVAEGRRVIQEVISQLEEVGKIETPPMQQGRRIVCTVSPR